MLSGCGYFSTPILEMLWRCTVALLNDCAVWPCGFCDLIVGWVAGFWWPGDTWCP